MRIEEIKIYKFDELSDEAKERARNWYREGGYDYDWWDDQVDTFADIAEKLGFSIDRGKHRWFTFSGFYSQGDGAAFTGTWYPPKAPIREIKALGYDWKNKDCAELLTIARDVWEIVKHIPVRDRGDVACKVKNSWHGNGMHTDSDSNYRNTDELNDAVLDVAKDFAHWAYKSLEQEWEYLNSDEQVDESIRCNEYDFTEDGSCW